MNGNRITDYIRYNRWVGNRWRSSFRALYRFYNRRRKETLVMTLVIIMLGISTMYLLWANKKLNRDVNNLYSSRDSLWKELGNEAQARKRQVGTLRKRFHGLRMKPKP